ncbi:hypothetical protein QYM36_001518 [Artemia franciscana]|uniref:Uncharacterized protein n=1 Tax=Artemia franciscana TaxID=6661 RepID=A0AA88IB56_ARTSF|nr:hypothetical protein QYM36_001518 [Artemia franciscana]
MVVLQSIIEHKDAVERFLSQSNALQEPEKMKDEDLFKYLPELKKSNGACKRLKCIPGQLKLDVSSCPTEPKYCLTSKLAKIEPYPGKLQTL